MNHRSEEHLNGLTLVWVAGLPATMKDAMRHWVEYYVDLLPVCEKLVVVSADDEGTDWFVYEQHLPIPGVSVLQLNEILWNRFGPVMQEVRFLVDRIGCCYGSSGSLRIARDGEPVLTLRDGREIKSTAFVTQHVTSVALEVVSDRAGRKEKGLPMPAQPGSFRL